MTRDIVPFSDHLPEPIELLVGMIESSGLTIGQAVLRYSFFVDPEAVRVRTPYFPECARKSRMHYPGVDRGGRAVWQGRTVKVGDNARAQMAWSKYTGRAVHRGSGYGVRHIWGHPWDPDAFTAGWNLCYMPFWLGMLTEEQHPHPDVVKVLRQVSWDLFFRGGSVCPAPAFVSDPGFELRELVRGEPIQILKSQAGELRPRRNPVLTGDPSVDKIKAIRARRSASWSNLTKAVLALQGKHHDLFGTANVEASSKSIVRLMIRETGLTLAELGELLATLGSRGATKKQVQQERSLSDGDTEEVT